MTNDDRETLPPPDEPPWASQLILQQESIITILAQMRSKLDDTLERIERVEVNQALLQREFRGFRSEVRARVDQLEARMDRLEKRVEIARE